MISSKINTLLQLLYVLARGCACRHSACRRRAWSRRWVAAHVPTLLLSGFLYVREFTRRALEVARA